MAARAGILAGTSPKFGVDVTKIAYKFSHVNSPLSAN
jgi:hypothetical protein